MEELVIRLVIPARQKLLHVTKKLMESDIGKELLEKWNEFTSFINFDNNMLEIINSRHYEQCCGHYEQLCSSTHLPSVDIPSGAILNVVNILKSVSVTYKISKMQNFLGHQVHQSSKLYRKMCNPLALFSDKLNPLSIPGIQSYMTYNLLCNSLLNNFYIEKQHKEVKQLLKCRYKLISLDNVQHMTTTYVNSTEMKSLIREIVRELLKIGSCDFEPSRRDFQRERDDIRDRKDLMEINQKVFQEVEKELNSVKLLHKIDRSSSEDLKAQTTNHTESSKYVPAHTTSEIPLI